MLNVTTVAVGELEANCHIAADTQGNAVLIDPGAEPARILEEIEALGVKPLAMLLTHAHFDHFGAAAEIGRQLHLPLYVHPLDEPMLMSAAASLAESLGLPECYHMPAADSIRHIAEGDVLEFSPELTFTV